MTFRPKFCSFVVRCQTLAVAFISGSVSIAVDQVAFAGDRPMEGRSMIVQAPVAIVSSSGDVHGAEALLRGGSATLTFTRGGLAPSIVLDYGRDVGGVPVFDVVARSGQPDVKLAFSESLPFLTTNGDGGALFDGLGVSDAFRADLFPAVEPGHVENALTQGGERYELITLTSPGTVVVRLPGIRSAEVASRDERNTGYFRSSDARLNEIWALGARTMQLCELPAGAVAPAWQASPSGIRTHAGSGLVAYLAGSTLHDYTASFDVRILHNQASWLLRDTVPVTITASDNVYGSPSSVVIGTPPGPSPVAPVGASVSLATKSLPFPISAGSWLHVVSTVQGSTLTVSVNGTVVVEATIPVAAADAFNPLGTGNGGFGFYNAPAADTEFRHLEIVDSSGAAIFSQKNDAATIAAFAAGTNEIPVIVDGAKRDRFVFTSDLGVSGVAGLYADGNADFFKGSLTLLGAYQKSDGEVSSVALPQTTLDATTGDGLSLGFSYYSLPYSLQFINALESYYLFTGDFSLVKRQWPTVERELRYLKANTDARGLVTTSPFDGFSWHVDLPLVGTVTEYNNSYAQALTNAARLADALGHGDFAASLRVQAAIVRAAINDVLFNRTTGLYDVSDTLRGFAAQDANALAIVDDVAAPKRFRSILRHLDADLGTAKGPLSFPASSGLVSLISPFISGYEAEAYFKSGDAAGALALIRAVWGNMLSDSAYSTGGAFEAMLPDGSPTSSTTSLAHGWSTGATTALSRYVLGVSPIAPGFSTVLVAPQPGDLDWAEGRVPTPHGAVSVAWRRVAKAFALDVVIPGGSFGTIALPQHGTETRLIVNGRVQVGSAETLNGVPSVVLTDVPPGYYHILSLAAG